MPLRTGRPPLPEPREGFRAVGYVERPWGLHGTLKVLPLTDFPERFDAGAQVYLCGAPRTIGASRWQKGRVYLTFDGINSPEAADAYRSELLEIPDSDRPDFGPDEYYLDEIVGCTVVNEAGDLLGVIRDVLQPGANDVYVIARPGRKDLLIPAVAHVVREVDIAARRLVVELLPGLDPDDAGDTDDTDDPADPGDADEASPADPPDPSPRN